MQAILKSNDGGAEFGIVLDWRINQLIADYVQEPSFFASIYLCGQHERYKLATFIRHSRLRLSEATALWDHLVKPDRPITESQWTVHRNHPLVV